jgi:hypothetical protein
MHEYTLQSQEAVQRQYTYTIKDATTGWEHKKVKHNKPITLGDLLAYADEYAPKQIIVEKIGEEFMLTPHAEGVMWAVREHRKNGTPHTLNII